MTVFFFGSYDDELKEKLEWVYPSDTSAAVSVKETRTAEPDVVSVPPVNPDNNAQVASKTATSADALIDSLLND